MKKSRITLLAAAVAALLTGPAVADPPAIDARAICAKAKTPGDCLADRAFLGTFQTKTALFLHSLRRSDTALYRDALEKKSDARREIEAVAEWAAAQPRQNAENITRCADEFAAGVDELAPRSGESHSRWNDRTESIERTISRACDRLRTRPAPAQEAKTEK